MDLYIKYATGAHGSWERGWWRARLDRHGEEKLGWRARGHVRRKMKQRALNMMHRCNLWRDYDGFWMSAQEMARSSIAEA